MNIKFFLKKKKKKKKKTFIFYIFFVSFLAIKQPDSKGKGEENIGAILGGVFGGLAFLILVFVCYKLFQRRRYKIFVNLSFI